MVRKSAQIPVDQSENPHRIAPASASGSNLGSVAVDPYACLPHVADGLTRLERVVLWQLREAQREFGGRPVPTAALYGRVVEHVNIGIAEFQAVLARMVGRA